MTRSAVVPLAAILLAPLLLASPRAADDWPRFRGPNGAGVSDAKLPASWTDKDVAWKADLPGTGHSSPVVAGGRVFVTAADPKRGKRFVACVSLADGKTAWTKEADTKAYHTHARNSVATSTPAADADRVYCLWTTPEKVTAIAYSHAGEVAWEADLGPYKGNHGAGVSPILVGGVLIVPNDQDNGGSVIGLDAKTGKHLWAVPRKGKNATYSTPCAFEAKGRPTEVLLTNWTIGVTSLDPRTGKQNWSVSVFDTATQERAIASPVVAGDLVLVTSGFVTGKKEFVALRIGPGGPKEVWRRDREVAYMPTPLVKGDRVYLCSEQGFATCLDVATGKEIWQERLAGTFSASPVCAGGHIYCVSDKGDVFVLAAKDEFEQLARVPLGGPSQATPAIAGGKIVFRTDKCLIAVAGE
jgi:outer membrane protein assembly factor BamB